MALCPRAPRSRSPRKRAIEARRHVPSCRGEAATFSSSDGASSRAQPVPGRKSSPSRRGHARAAATRPERNSPHVTVCGGQSHGAGADAAPDGVSDYRFGTRRHVTLAFNSRTRTTELLCVHSSICELLHPFRVSFPNRWIRPRLLFLLLSCASYA